MRIGIDATSFKEPNGTGKEMVLLYLLRAWHESCKTKDITLFCTTAALPLFKKAAPDANFFSIGLLFGEYRIPLRFFFNYQLHGAIKKHSLDLFFFANKDLPSKVSLAKFSLSIPSIALMHDMMPVVRAGYADRAAIRIEDHFRKRNGIIAISKWDQQMMELYYPQHRDKIRHIYNPVVLEPFNLPLPEEKRDNTIVAVNIFWPHKMVQVILSAFAALQNREKYRLVLIGTISDYAEYMQKYAKTLNIDHLVEFTGFIPEEELRERLAKARLYVSASRWEGFGLTAVEAMILGTPAVLANATATHEVTAGLASYYYPPENVVGLTAALEQALSTPIDIEKLRSISRLLWERYDYRKIAAKYWNYFEEVVRNEDGNV